MISADELLRRIRGAAKYLAGYEGDSDSETYLNIQKCLRGGWLFDLVAGEAARFYGIEPAALVINEDFVKDVDLRIEGIAKMIARRPEEVKEIIDRSHKELDDRLLKGYLGTAARHTQTDRIREGARDLKRHTDTDKIDEQAAKQSGPPRDDPMPDFDTQPHDESREVRDERIRLLFGAAAKRPAHELLVFAWCPPTHRVDRDRPGRLPQAIVDDFGTLSLDQLADCWIEVFAEIEKRDQAEVRCLFAGILRENGNKRLSEFWDPLAAVEDWIGTVGKKGADGQPFYKRVAFLYAEGLRYNAARILTQLGPRRLDQLAAEFVPKYAGHGGQSAKWDPGSLKKLLAEKSAKQAAKPLADSYKPSAEVDRWKDSVAAQRTAVEFQQLSHGLQPILKAGFAVWEKLAFLHCHCFGYKPELTADRYRGKSLEAMRIDLIFKFEDLWDLEEEQVVEAMWGLRNALIGLHVPATLGACAGEGCDLAQEVQAWSNKVREAVEPEFAHNDGVRLFALRHHLTSAKGACA